jgi:hypothetical protein
VWKLISEIRERRRATIILATTSIYEAEALCDRIAVLERELLFVGPPPRAQEACTPNLQVEIFVRRDHENAAINVMKCVACAQETERERERLQFAPTHTPPRPRPLPLTRSRFNPNYRMSRRYALVARSDEAPSAVRAGSFRARSFDDHDEKASAAAAPASTNTTPGPRRRSTPGDRGMCTKMVFFVRHSGGSLIDLEQRLQRLIAEEKSGSILRGYVVMVRATASVGALALSLSLAPRVRTPRSHGAPLGEPRMLPAAQRQPPARPRRGDARASLPQACAEPLRPGQRAALPLLPPRPS